MNDRQMSFISWAEASIAEADEIAVEESNSLISDQERGNVRQLCYTSMPEAEAEEVLEYLFGYC